MRQQLAILSGNPSVKPALISRIGKLMKNEGLIGRAPADRSAGPYGGCSGLILCSSIVMTFRKAVLHEIDRK